MKDFKVRFNKGINIMWLHYVIIGIGGALGAVARVALGRILPIAAFGMPLQIFFINLIGCFAFGLLTEVLTLYWTASFNIRSFLIPGFLSAFTTFSAFALESNLLIKERMYLIAIIYMILNFVLNISAFFGGMKLIKAIS